MKKDDQKDYARGTLTKGLETIAETVGVVAGLASRTFAPTGKPNAVQMLKDDHVLVEHLFEQFEQADDNRKRADIVRSTLDELEVHAALEEQIVYPAIRELDNEKEHQDKMDEAFEEHHIVKQLMAELREMTPQDERFAAKFTVLAESVRHHVREEEGEVLPKAEGSDLDLEELGRQMAERKQQLLQKTNRSGSQIRSEKQSGEGNGGVTKRKRAASGRAGVPKRQSRRGATAGKGRASTRTGATSTRGAGLSGKNARGASKASARSTSKARSRRGRASAGGKRTRR